MNTPTTSNCSCIACLLFAGILANPLALHAVDWTQFRGDGGTSAAAPADLPESLSSESAIQWTADLPGKGPSSPLVVGDKVFVTSSGGPEHQWIYVLCFNAADGKQIWQRKFWATGRPFAHNTSANAAPSPASDGERIYAFYSSNDLVCLDLDGNLIWFRGLGADYPKAGNDIGLASSTVVFGDAVIVQAENQGDSFAAAINKLTGETIWRIERTPDSCWSSPTVIPGAGNHPDQVVLHSRGSVSGVRIDNGEQLWKIEGDVHTTASTSYRDGVAYVPLNGTTAFKFDADGKAVKLWNAARMKPAAASPIVTDDHIYIRGRSGVVSRHSLADGSEDWKIRVGSNQVWSTPLVVGDRMYCFDYNGTAHTVSLGDKPEVTSTAKIGEVFQGSPALGGAEKPAIYVRSNSKLFKIANN